jgi:hypothetical protein
MRLHSPNAVMTTATFEDEESIVLSRNVSMPHKVDYHGMTAQAYTRWKNEARKTAKEQRLGRRVTTRYFCCLRNDDHIIEFVVIKPLDPNQRVFTLRPDPTDPTGIKQMPGQEWAARWEGPDVLVFKAADDYTGGPIGWNYHRRQVVEGMTEEQQRKFFFPGG